MKSICFSEFNTGGTVAFTQVSLTNNVSTFEIDLGIPLQPALLGKFITRIDHAINLKGNLPVCSASETKIMLVNGSTVEYFVGGIEFDQGVQLTAASNLRINGIVNIGYDVGVTPFPFVIIADYVALVKLYYLDV